MRMGKGEERPSPNLCNKAGAERTNNIGNNPSSEILILLDGKEDLISSATPRTLKSGDTSNEKTKTEKTEPHKLGEVRFEDMF